MHEDSLTDPRPCVKYIIAGKPRKPLFALENLYIWAEGDDLHIAAKDGLPPLEEETARIISCNINVTDSKWSSGAGVQLAPGWMRLGPVIVHTKPRDWGLGGES